jgi:predicted RNase H-like HicB family nuclease
MDSEAPTERQVRDHFMKYKIVLHHTEEGISVSVPALPGCWSEGDTEEEAVANIQGAIAEYLAALEDRFRDAEVREVEVQV